MSSDFVAFLDFIRFIAFSSSVALTGATAPHVGTPCGSEGNLLEIFLPSIRHGSSVGKHSTVLAINETKVLDIFCALVSAFEKSLQIYLGIPSVSKH